MEAGSEQRITAGAASADGASEAVGAGADESVLRRELLLGALARSILSGLEPHALTRSAVATIGERMDVDVCALFALSGDSLVATPADVFRRTRTTGSLAPVRVLGADEILERLRRDGEIAVSD